MNVTAVIPTLNPNEKILTVTQALLEAGFARVLLVDDGSRAECAPLFAALADMEGCVVLHHVENRGKGCGLKTAMTYFQEHPEEHCGIVTLDDDGQHTTEDALRCAQAVEQHPNSLILGVRNFNQADVPFKSRWGNKITAAVFRFACGIRVSDTQTGLRGIPAGLIPDMLAVKGERFEYETNMLLETSTKHIPIEEIPIRTVYSDNNRGTHFHPVRDAWQIYKQLLKFTLSSLLASAVDLGLFSLLSVLLPIRDTTVLVFTATLTARVCSSLVNFFTNRALVFGKKGSVGPAVVRYYVLCAAQGVASSLLVSLLSHLLSSHWMILWKVLVDTFLFLCSYKIQQNWVFEEKGRGKQA